MASPSPGRPRNGMHVHVQPGRQAGANHPAEPGARHAIGGLQATMAEAMLLFAPNANSSAAAEASQPCPMTAPTWGNNNRPWRCGCRSARRLRADRAPGYRRRDDSPTSPGSRPCRHPSWLERRSRSRVLIFANGYAEVEPSLPLSSGSGDRRPGRGGGAPDLPRRRGSAASRGPAPPSATASPSLI